MRHRAARPIAFALVALIALAVRPASAAAQAVYNFAWHSEVTGIVFDPNVGDFVPLTTSAGGRSTAAVAATPGGLVVDFDTPAGRAHVEFGNATPGLATNTRLPFTVSPLLGAQIGTPSGFVLYPPTPDNWLVSYTPLGGGDLPPAFAIQVYLPGSGPSPEWRFFGMAALETLAASFTRPLAGATISGTATVSMSASGAIGAANSFTLEVDGRVVSTQVVNGATASFALDTSTLPSGSHRLTVTIEDEAGQVATATETVVVSSASTGGFTAAFAYPASGAVVSGNQSVGMSTTAAWGTSKTWTLLVDGRAVLTQTTTGTTLWFVWDSTTVPNGTHTLTLRVANGSGTATATRSVTVKNP